MGNVLTSDLTQIDSLELAQALAAKLAIAPNDWHRLKGNRKIQAQQHLSAALVFLLNDNPAAALQHLEQAQGWLDRTISAPPCPDHGRKTAS
ncbi:DUF6439 family protein [Picosynechococcus sp. PCC 73109]|uniref:DUF6439 family protein n=1 Tax=Picosynechococcus sp. PCC 73109 TaxID=374982 RepID=UPI0007458339|nr:DUF6439 family protein [Picosynechococcus sp. PCC 73109]AMA08712.1 hypothetical protein AWQ23_04915 [Picosynechococcus sp. PCC 73109]